MSSVNGNLDKDSKCYAHYAKALYFMLFCANFDKKSNFMLFYDFMPSVTPAPDIQSLILNMKASSKLIWVFLFQIYLRS